MSIVTVEPLLHHCRREYLKCRSNLKIYKTSSVNCSTKLRSNGGVFCRFKASPRIGVVRASSADTAIVETFESTDVYFKESFPLKRNETTDGKIYVGLDHGKDAQNWQLTVGCTIPGKWILHWGVSYEDDSGSEWDQPPVEMRPPGSVPIKDYAIETPLSSSSLEGEISQEVKIDFNTTTAIAAINFVLKDEETGAWYQHRGRDFKVPLVDYLSEDDNVVGPKKGFSILPGC